VHYAELTAPEQRVLGCLIEKRWTTPDQYPLTLNALRLACNQSTNRDPVTDYDEVTVRAAAQRLCQYGIARLASGHSSRATKYRHLAEEALRLGREELAVLSVLLLRGPQTPGELKARSERMAPMASLDELDIVLESLIEDGFTRRLARRPGQKEERYEHTLGGAGDDAGGVSSVAQTLVIPSVAVAPAPALASRPTGASAAPGSATPARSAGPAPLAPALPGTPAAAGPTDSELLERIRTLESEVAELKRQVARLSATRGSDQVGSASPMA
jgi:uncharacterized protein YceH (UPF0502 family)